MTKSLKLWRGDYRAHWKTLQGSVNGGTSQSISKGILNYFPVLMGELLHGGFNILFEEVFKRLSPEGEYLGEEAIILFGY